MYEQSCCTCAGILGGVISPDDEKGSLRIRVAQRPLQCCGRIICQDCIHKNPRFATYCPFCQISTIPSRLPPGLRDPPAYSPPSSPSEEENHHPSEHENEHPPPYSLISNSSQPSSDRKAQDVIHFVDPAHETMSSISLRYNVPLEAMRRVNHLYADHLLAARRTVLIPGEYYKGGVSLSPRPVEGEEEELRKAKIRRWMVTCKVAEYDVALVYLKQAHYDLDQAVEAYRLDEEWESQNPLHSGPKGKTASRYRR
ncbi:MAG: hypothetical protein M1823_002194 [Watsoniomyces obsoletus]|nr:MAG: hypothetical protein M1823_002194 [Watsoniomyces obsoletus]